MTPNLLAAHLFAAYDPFCLHHLRPSNCRHAVITAGLRERVAEHPELFRMEELGRSIEGRSISMVGCGRGPLRVLLWSQMHGDEPTATLALMDIFHFLGQRFSSEGWVREMLEQITIHAIPMLNPDGAERCKRHTAVQVDMNRDARRLITPEARLLKETRQKVSPTFGFNLHDQDLSSVGGTDQVAALALLAPALDEKKSAPLVRVRALRIISLLTRMLNQFIEGHITTYDDSFEPRAFGDSMQAWGTSTVLIESGHWPKDPEKLFIRKLNFVAILSALRAIGNGSYQDADFEISTALPQNGTRMFDVIIRGVTLEHSSRWQQKVDLGLIFPGPQRDRLKSPQLQSPVIATIKQIGDLEGYGGLEVMEANGRKLPAEKICIDKEFSLNEFLDGLQLYYPR